MKNIFIIVCLSILISSCATKYQSMGFTGGYEDYDFGDGKFKVEFLGNGYTNSETVKKYARTRAKELCKGDYDVLDEKLIKRAIMTFPKAIITFQCK